LPKTFWQVGNFDFLRINYKNNLKSVSGKKIITHIVYGHETIDIDNLDDVKKANMAITKKDFIK
jgi:CMP-N-acetylneuraminic acid synthetase